MTGVDATRPAATPTVAGKPAAAAGKDLHTASRAFEAVILRQLIASMRAASLGDDALGSEAGDRFREMGDAQLADVMAGRFGIAAMIEKQLGKGGGR